MTDHDHEPGARRSPKPPKGLEVAGRSYWRTIVKQLELHDHELLILAQVCREVDIIATLEAAIERDGATAVLSDGRSRLHPAIAELRQHRTVLARLVAGLNIPAEHDGRSN